MKSIIRYLLIGLFMIQGYASVIHGVGFSKVETSIAVDNTAPASLDRMGNPTGLSSDDEEFIIDSALVANAVPPNVINVIPSPTSLTNGITFDGEFLWVGPFLENKLYQISPIDGAVIKTIPVEVKAPLGLAFDGTSLWLTVNESKLIKKIDPDNGNILASFSTPANPAASNPAGLTWDGTHLWNNDPKGIFANNNLHDSTFEITTTGDIVRGFDAHGSFPTGAAWDGDYLWLADNISEVIYQVDPESFEILYSIKAPGGRFPNGLAWDGNYLWVANNDSDSLYQLDVSASICGDADGDRRVNFDDLSYLINFYFMFGDPPMSLEAVDVNEDGRFDLSDIISLADFLNNNGPAPCSSSEPPPSFYPKKKLEALNTDQSNF